MLDKTRIKTVRDKLREMKAGMPRHHIHIISIGPFSRISVIPKGGVFQQRVVHLTVYMLISSGKKSIRCIKFYGFMEPFSLILLFALSYMIPAAALPYAPQSWALGTAIFLTSGAALITALVSGSGNWFAGLNDELGKIAEE